MPEPAHVAIVLAAGGSRRLGRPKQLLTRDGETLVHRAVRLAAASGAQRVLLVTGAHAPAMIAAVADLRCDCVHNADWATGLASSLVKAAQALDDASLRRHARRALILGCDQPALEHAHLMALLKGAAMRGYAATLHRQRPGIPAVVPLDMLIGALQAVVLHGDVGLGPLLRALPAEALHALDAPELMFDLDTPDDVARAVASGLIDADSPAVR